HAHYGSVHLGNEQVVGRYCLGLDHRCSVGLHIGGILLPVNQRPVFKQVDELRHVPCVCALAKPAARQRAERAMLPRCERRERSRSDKELPTLAPPKICLVSPIHSYQRTSWGRRIGIAMACLGALALAGFVGSVVGPHFKAASTSPTTTTSTRPRSTTPRHSSKRRHWSLPSSGCQRRRSNR